MSEAVDLYRRWATAAAQNSSPVYERLALAVADDDTLVALLEQVEIGKRQPNLLLVRCVGTEFRWRTQSQVWPGHALTRTVY